VNQKLSHVVLLILPAGDVATNPGPAYYSASTNSAPRKQVKCLVLNTGVRAVMAFSRGFLCSRNLLIILYIYLILNGSILKKQREKCLSCTSSILYVSELLACSRPVYNGNIRRKTVKRKPLENSTYFLLGSRLFINTSIAIILLRLSGDIESNAGPVFEIPGCLKRGLKVSHLNVRSLLPKIDLVRLFISKNPFDVFTLSETWLKPSITNAEINIPNYLITHQDRKDKLVVGQLFMLGKVYLTELEIKRLMK
jgi:hypothetical protein